LARGFNGPAGTTIRSPWKRSASLARRCAAHGAIGRRSTWSSSSAQPVRMNSTSASLAGTG
jgi:hypothetical protein